MGATIKLLSAQLPSEVIVFFRNFMGLIVLFPWLVRHGLQGLVTDQLRWHLLRALAGLGAMYCFFYSLAHLQLAEAVLLALTSPFFMPLIALFWLGEPVPVKVRWAIGIGFLGVALILQPGFDAISAVAPIALMGAALAALAKVTVRRLSVSESSALIVFYFGIVATLVSAIPLTWAWVTPEPNTWILVVALGVFATAGQLLMTRAFALAPAGQIGPFTYVAVIFASLYGWLWWGEVIEPMMVYGALLIVAAGMLAAKAHRDYRNPRGRLLDSTS